MVNSPHDLPIAGVMEAVKKRMWSFLLPGDQLPSGKHTNNDGKSQFLMNYFDWAIFNSKV